MVWRAAGLAMAVLRVACAQSLVDAQHLDAARQAFESPRPSPHLRCQMTGMRPAVDFAFRFRTGYTIDFPLRQFEGSGHRLEVLLRVTPEGRDPVYLTTGDSLPDVPDTRQNGEVTGSFRIGQGAYTVDALIQDDEHRVCRGRWRTQARLGAGEHDIQPGLSAGAVLAPDGAVAPQPPKGGPEIGRLTIFLHAASLSPNASKLAPGEVQLLTDALSSLLIQLPARSVRLVVFSLDQGAVVLRLGDFNSPNESLTSGDLDRVAAALTQLQLSTIDYHALQNQSHAVDLLAGLIRTELRSPKPPDGIIVLGPRTREAGASLPEAANPSAAVPPMFYLQVHPARQFRVPGAESPGGGRRGGRGGAGMGPRGQTGIDEPIVPPEHPDAIAQLVGRLKGETSSLYTAHDFAAAIRRIAARIPAAASSEAAPAAVSPRSSGSRANP